jgi:hypothetical protein
MAKYALYIHLIVSLIGFASDAPCTAPRSGAWRIVYLISPRFTFADTIDHAKDYSSQNSDTALGLYKRMGYSMVFEYIFPTGSWTKTWNGNVPIWQMDSSFYYGRRYGRGEKACSAYVAEQKARMASYGLEYCPYYNDWGWEAGGGIASISPRALQADYRENIVRGRPMAGGGIDDSAIYATNIFHTINDPVAPFLNSWTHNGLCAMSSTMDTMFVRCNAAGQQVGDLNFQIAATRSLDSNRIASHQRLRFIARINIPAQSGLLPGDAITCVLWRYFDDTAAVKKIPLMSLVNANSWAWAVDQKCYTVTDTSGGMISFKQWPVIHPNDEAIIRISKTSGGLFPAPDTLNLWTDSAFLSDLRVSFSAVVKWEYGIFKHEGAQPCNIRVVDCKVHYVDPVTELAYYEGWEKDTVAFNKYVARYSAAPYNESRIRTMAQYGRGQRVPFSGKRRNGHPCRSLSGHFLPLNIAVTMRQSVDPLSPAMDLVSKEMWKLIRKGLSPGNAIKEPVYAFLCGDETMGMRRDAVGRLYAKPTYYKYVLKEFVNRYATGFNTAKPSATFCFFPDAILPCQETYYYWADSVNDVRCLDTIRNDPVLKKFQANLWAYDGTGAFHSIKNGAPTRLGLQDTADIMESLQRWSRQRDLGWMFLYATDGTTADIRALDPAVAADSLHIPSEILSARMWCDIAQKKFPSNFKAYSYVGWGTFRSNSWDGLYPIAYFGWTDTSAGDLTRNLKKKSAAKDCNAQPVLDQLMKNEWNP